MNGTILILNGTSSSGKTAIIRELQEILPEPFLEAGVDKFIWMLPSRYLRQPSGMPRLAGPARRVLWAGV